MAKKPKIPEKLKRWIERKSAITFLMPRSKWLGNWA